MHPVAVLCILVASCLRPVHPCCVRLSSCRLLASSNPLLISGPARALLLIYSDSPYIPPDPVPISVEASRRPHHVSSLPNFIRDANKISRCTHPVASLPYILIYTCQTPGRTRPVFIHPNFVRSTAGPPNVLLLSWACFPAYMMTSLPPPTLRSRFTISL